MPLVQNRSCWLAVRCATTELWMLPNCILIWLVVKPFCLSTDDSICYTIISDYTRVVTACLPFLPLFAIRCCVRARNVLIICSVPRTDPVCSFRFITYLRGEEHATHDTQWIDKTDTCTGVSGWMSEWVKEVNDWRRWVNKSMSQWDEMSGKNEWLNEWMSDWMRWMQDGVSE